MAHVRVTGVIKDPGSNSEHVTAVGVGTGWGSILNITFVAPSGTHKVDQSVEIQDIPGTRGYS